MPVTGEASFLPVTGEASFLPVTGEASFLPVTGEGAFFPLTGLLSTFTVRSCFAVAEALRPLETGRAFFANPDVLAISADGAFLSAEGAAEPLMDDTFFGVTDEITGGADDSLEKECFPLFSEDKWVPDFTLFSLLKILAT